MLHFHGIRFQKGMPKRYQITYDLSSPLIEALKLSAKYDYDLEQCIAEINYQINQLYQGQTRSKYSVAQLKLFTAQLSRTKDIINYLVLPKEHITIKTNIANILLKPNTIEQKWHFIEELLIKQAFELLDNHENLNNDTSCVHQLLKMITLYFLEQTEETPATNHLLKFIPQAFPETYWINTENAEKASHWEPDHLYCRKNYLTNRLFNALAQEKNKTLIKAQQKTFSQLRQLCRQSQPDHIELIINSQNIDQQQLSLIPENLTESLIHFQRLIQKKYSHDGVKHLLAIIKQFAEKIYHSACYFNFIEHFELLGINLNNQKSLKKHFELAQTILQEMQEVQVLRSWNIQDEPLQEKNALILEINRYFQKTLPSYPKIQFLLDPLFYPTDNNPIWMGAALTLIPQHLFQESSREHSLLPGLSAYFSGTWLLEYPLQKGLLEKNAEEIFTGCAFNVPASGKYRMLHKLKSELVYMEKKEYIHKFTLLRSKEQNPWKDIYRITAPKTYLQAIEKLYIPMSHTTKKELPCG